MPSGQLRLGYPVSLHLSLEFQRHEYGVAEGSALLHPTECGGQFDDDGEYWCSGVQVASDSRRHI